MGSRVVPTTATPDQWWLNNEGTGRSTVRSQAIVMIAGRQMRQASKKKEKKNNAEVTPQRACHRPIPTIHGLWPVKEATCGQLPIGSTNMLHWERPPRTLTCEGHCAHSRCGHPPAAPQRRRPCRQPRPPPLSSGEGGRQRSCSQRLECWRWRHRCGRSRRWPPPDRGGAAHAAPARSLRAARGTAAAHRTTAGRGASRGGGVQRRSTPHAPRPAQSPRRRHARRSRVRGGARV